MSNEIRYALVECDTCRYVIRDTAPIEEWNEVQQLCVDQEIADVTSCWCVTQAELDQEICDRGYAIDFASLPVSCDPDGGVDVMAMLVGLDEFRGREINEPIPEDGR